MAWWSSETEEVTDWRHEHKVNWMRVERAHTDEVERAGEGKRLIAWHILLEVKGRELGAICGHFGFVWKELSKPSLHRAQASDWNRKAGNCEEHALCVKLRKQDPPVDANQWCRGRHHHPGSQAIRRALAQWHRENGRTHTPVRGNDWRTKHSVCVRHA